MFHFRGKNRRQRSRKASGASHRGAGPTRLRLEALEGRLLLSAAPLEPPTFDFTATPFAVEIGQPDPGSNPPLRMTAIVEGGLIPLSYGADTLSLDGQAAPTSTIVLNSWPNGTTRGTLFVVSSVTSDTLRLNDVEVFSSGIQPIVIPIGDPPGLAKPNTGSISIDRRQQASSRDEGGSIRIDSILAKDKSDRGWEKDNRAVATAAREPADQPAGDLASSLRAKVSQLDSPNLLSHSAESGVSGEWGRAMIFEIAGGEPQATHGQAIDTSLNAIRPQQNEQSQPTNQPSSSADDEAGKSPDIRQGAGAARAGNTFVETGPGEAPPLSQEAMPSEAGERSESNGPRGTVDGPFGSASISSGSPTTMLEAHANAVSMRPSREKDASRAHALAEWGERPAAISKSLDDEARPASFGALPLVTVLALEGIAVGYWRRTKDAAAVTAGPPRRSTESA